MIAAWAASLLFAAAVAGVVPAGPACQNDAAVEPPTRTGPARFTGSAAYSELRRSGREVVAEKVLDIDADGRPDALVVSRSDEGLELSAYRNTAEQGFDLLSRSAALAGEELARFDALDLGGRRGFLLDVIEDSPDEADHHLAMFVANPAGLAQVLDTSWQQKHSEEDAGRQAEEVVDLGGRTLGMSMAAAGTGGWPEVELRYAPKALVFSAGAGKPIRVIIGARVRRFRHTAGRYQQVADAFDAYLERVAAKASGAALGAKLGELPAAILLDWDRAAPIRALGITACPREGDDPSGLAKLKIQFEGASALSVDLARPAAAGEGIAGVGSYRAKAGVQTLVILRKAVEASGLSLTVEAAGSACLAEVIPFVAEVDRRTTSSASSTPP